MKEDRNNKYSAALKFNLMKLIFKEKDKQL